MSKEIQLVIKKEDISNIPDSKQIKNIIITKLVNGYIYDRPKKDRFIRCTSFRLPDPIVDKLEEISKSNKIGISKLIRHMIGFDY